MRGNGPQDTCVRRVSRREKWRALILSEVNSHVTFTQRVTHAGTVYGDVYIVTLVSIHALLLIHMICGTTKATHQVSVSAGYAYSHSLWIGLGQYIRMGALNQTGSVWWQTGFRMEGTYVGIFN